MIRLTCLLIVFLSFCETGYSQGSNKKSVHINELIPVPVQKYDLQISEFLYIQPVNDFYIIIHRKPKGVSVINQQGEYVTSLGGEGRGPFEWQSPSFLQYIRGEIVVWDSGNLKLMVFDKNLEPVREYMEIRHAINGYNISADNYLAVFNQPRLEDEFIHVYEMNKNKEYTIMQSLGQLTDEGRTMLFLEMMGGVLWNGGELLWVDPAVPGFFVFNKKENEQRKYTFNDEHFSVENWNEPREMNQSTFNKIEEYLFSNSRIVSLQKLKDHILLEVEHFPNENSVIHYHIFDITYNYIANVEAGQGGWMNYIRGVNGNKLYYWGENYLETGETGSIRVREIVFN